MKKFLVWGSGAIGGTMGAYLARAGALVTFVDRDMNHVKAMNSKGLFITARLIELIHDIENGTRSLSTDNLDLLMEVMS